MRRNKSSSPAPTSPWRPVWLTNDLIYLLAGRGLRSLAQGYLLIIVPLYLDLLGYNAEHLGILFAASAVVSAIMVGAVGILSDRFGRKTLLIVISLMMAGGGIVFAVSSNFIALTAGAALGTIGRGGGAGSGGAWGPYYPAEQPLIAEQAADHQRTMIFGVLSFVGVLASAFGSLLAYAPELLHQNSGAPMVRGYRALFILTAVLGVAMALIVIPVRETHRLGKPSQHKIGRQKTHRSILGVSLTHETWGLIVRFMVTNSVNGLAVGMLGPFVTYWFYRRYGVGAGTIGSLFFILNLIAAVPYLTAGRVARRFGVVSSVVICRAISSVLLIVLAVMPTFALAGVVYGIRVIFNTLSLPVRQSYIMGIIRPEERASAAGLSNLPSQASSAVSPYFAGYFMQNIALSLPLEVAAILMGVNTALYYFFFHKIRPPEELEITEEPGGR
ncbi:MAG: MFS transporter [Candidatus Binataceae bacterium]